MEKVTLFSKRKILIGLSIAAFLGPFTQTIYTPNLPEVGDFFNANQFMVNFTISLYTLILAFSQFIIGPYADTRGRKATLLPGLFLFIAGSVLCYIATDYYVFLMGRAIQAFGISAGSIVAAAVIGDIYDPRDRGNAMSVYQTMVFLGPVLGPVLGSLISANFHWQSAFAVLVVGGLFAYFFNRFVLHETLQKDTVPKKITFRTFKGIVGNRAASSIMFLGFFQFYGYYLYLVFLPSLLDQLFQVSLAVKGLFFLPLTAGIVIGTIIGGKIQEKLTRKSILIYTSYSISLTVFLFFIALTFKLMAMPVLVFFLLIYGVLLGISLPSQSTTLVNLFLYEKGTAMGVYNFIRFIGAAIGPLVGAFIYNVGGNQALYGSLFIFLLIAAFIVQRKMYDPYDSAQSA